MNKFKPKRAKSGSAQLVLKKSKMQNKFIKEEKEVDLYNSKPYFYYKHSDRRLGSNKKQQILKGIVDSFKKLDHGNYFENENDMKLLQEKLYLKSKVANFYHDIAQEQKQVKQERRKFDLEEDQCRKQEREDKQLFDVDEGINKLIKDSIIETYEIVRNNKRASKIKMYVCSASNYLKKTKRL